MDKDNYCLYDLDLSARITSEEEIHGSWSPLKLVLPMAIFIIDISVLTRKTLLQTKLIESPKHLVDLSMTLCTQKTNSSANQTDQISKISCWLVNDSVPTRETLLQTKLIESPKHLFALSMTLQLDLPFGLFCKGPIR